MKVSPHIVVGDAGRAAEWDVRAEERRRVLHPLADAFWGGRHGQIVDPFGHRWGLSQHVRDVPRDEIVRLAAEAFGG